MGPRGDNLKTRPGPLCGKERTRGTPCARVGQKVRAARGRTRLLQVEVYLDDVKDDKVEQVHHQGGHEPQALRGAQNGRDERAHDGGRHQRHNKEDEERARPTAPRSRLGRREIWSGRLGRRGEEQGGVRSR